MRVGELCWQLGKESIAGAIISVKLGELRSCQKICHSELQNKSFRVVVVALELEVEEPKSCKSFPKFPDLDIYCTEV
jgi:hypothetical protein